MGKRIYFSKGNQTNIKITTKEDLELFEGYVLEQQRRCRKVTYGDVIVFLADGFEECEELLVVDLLRRAGIRTIMASVMEGLDVMSSREILIQADCMAKNIKYETAQMIVLPGGRLGTENLGKSELVREKCLEFAEKKKVAALCAAPSILASMGLLEGRKTTVHPDYLKSMFGADVLDEPVVIDKNIISGQGLAAAIPFALEIIRLLVGNDIVERIKKAICYRD